MGSGSPSTEAAMLHRHVSTVTQNGQTVNGQSTYWHRTVQATIASPTLLEKER